MFEQTLVKRQRSGRRGWMLASAVAIHALALTTVVLGSVWSVGEVPPPPENAVFTAPVHVTHLVFAAQPERPPAPPPPAETRPAAAPTPSEAQPADPAPPTVQPETVPETAPSAPATPANEWVAGGPDVPSAPPGGGGGTDPNGPAWSGGGEGETAQPLDARMTRPEAIHKPQPRYTESARKAGRQGVVILQATIDRSGAVADLRLVKSLGLGLDEEALTAVRQWRFTPATLQGRPVPVFFQLTVRFTIR